MDDPSFEINKMDWYVPANVIENDFINSKNSEADQATYGLTYSVRFVGNADTYLWTAKTKPVEGRKYWGHIQPTSGTGFRFKVDKDAPGSDPVPTSEGQKTTVVSKPLDNKYLRDITAIPLDVYRVRANIMGLPGSADVDTHEFWEMVKADSEELLAIIERVRES